MVLGCGGSLFFGDVVAAVAHAPIDVLTSMYIELATIGLSGFLFLKKT